MFLRGYPLEAKTAPKKWNQSVHISWARLASFCHLGVISDPLIVSKFLNETHDSKGQENQIYTIVKSRETFYRRHTVPVTSCSEVKYVLKRVSVGSKDCTKEMKPKCAYFLVCAYSKTILKKRPYLNIWARVFPPTVSVWSVTIQLPIWVIWPVFETFLEELPGGPVCLPAVEIVHVLAPLLIWTADEFTLLGPLSGCMGHSVVPCLKKMESVVSGPIITRIE